MNPKPNRFMGLVAQVNQIEKLLPTPRACKTTDENLESWQKRKDAGKVFTPPLTLAVRMLPTPCASEARQGYQNRNNGKRGQQESLSTVIQGGPADTVGGSLNPQFVEWLMGYPIGWTSCAASATPSSRKSRKPSSNK
jgi:hypothetical protein